MDAHKLRKSFLALPGRSCYQLVVRFECPPSNSPDHRHRDRVWMPAGRCRAIRSQRRATRISWGDGSWWIRRIKRKLLVLLTRRIAKWSHRRTFGGESESLRRSMWRWASSMKCHFSWRGQFPPCSFRAPWSSFHRASLKNGCSSPLTRLNFDLNTDLQVVRRQPGESFCKQTEPFRVWNSDRNYREWCPIYLDRSVRLLKRNRKPRSARVFWRLTEAHKSYVIRSDTIVDSGDFENK